MKRSMKTMDGNHAAAHASYAYTDVAAIYPITPSSVMAEATDDGQTQEEKYLRSDCKSNRDAVRGRCSWYCTRFPGSWRSDNNLYSISGSAADDSNLYKSLVRLPGVFNVSARTLASHALCIFGDHLDVYACRQTGCAMLCESSV